MDPFLLQVMANHASRLVAAADRLDVDLPLDDGRNECFPTDAAVLNALAAEIALKALLCQQNGLNSTRSVRGVLSKKTSLHDLKALFHSLPPSIRGEIEEALLDSLPSTQQLIYSEFQDTSGLGPGPATRMQIAPMTMDRWLDSARLTFEVWRYHYEEATVGPLNVTILRCFAIAVIAQLRAQIAGGTSGGTPTP